MKIKKYLINGIEYQLKEKYTLKDWGLIIKIIAGLNIEDQADSFILLFSDNRINDLLNILLDKPIEGDIYEDDFESVSSVVNDFFSRKKNLMKNMAQR